MKLTKEIIEKLIEEGAINIGYFKHLWVYNKDSKYCAYASNRKFLEMVNEVIPFDVEETLEFAEYNGKRKRNNWNKEVEKYGYDYMVKYVKKFGTRTPLFGYEDIRIYGD